MAVVSEVVWDATELGGLMGQIAMGYGMREAPLRGAGVRLTEPDLIEALEAVARSRAAMERVEVELVREALVRGLPAQAALSAVNWVRCTEGGAVPPPDAAQAARVVRIATAAALGSDAVTDRALESFYAGGLSASKSDQLLRLVADVQNVADADELAEVVEAMRAGSIDGSDPLGPGLVPDLTPAGPGDSAGGRMTAGPHDSAGDGHDGDVVSQDDSEGVGGRTSAVPSWVTGLAPEASRSDRAGTPVGRGPAGWGLTLRELGKAISYTRRMLKPADLLKQEAAAARRGRALHSMAGPGGLTEYRLTVDPEGAAIIDAAVAALSRPIPTAHGVADLRTAAQRRADALIEIVQRGLDAGSNRPGQPKTQVVVTIGLSDLRAATNGAGITSTGQVLTPATVRRMACDAGIIPMVLGSRGKPLDVGRTKRFFTDVQRLALFQRDRHCTFPGCTMPADWCDAHHLIPWAHGGQTNLDSAALLCRLHHTYVHDHALTATLTAMGVRWHLQN